MKNLYPPRILLLTALAVAPAIAISIELFSAQASTAQASTPASTGLPVLPVTVLVQSPAETKTDLQILCLFRSTPANSLQGALLETNERLHGVLDQLRKPGLFDGELGETVLLTPASGTLAAKRLLIIGLGDSSTFNPTRMRMVGKIAYREAQRLGVAHPFFAPTVLDGGVTTYTTGQVAEQVVLGFREAMATEAVLGAGNAAQPPVVADFVYLAGSKHAADTQDGIARAQRAAGHR
jgi:hypothetical protein